MNELEAATRATPWPFREQFSSKKSSAGYEKATGEIA